MKITYLPTLRISLLFIVLAFFTAGCGSNSATGSGTGSVSARLVWGANTTTPLAKTAAKAPTGIITIRVIVSAVDMSDVKKDFDEAAGGGTVDGIPAGSGRTIKVQGIESGNLIKYQSQVDNITIQAGQDTNAGTIIMKLIPVANAGPAESVDTGAVVTLDGSASIGDVNSDALTYRWVLTSKPSGSSATLSNATAVKPSFTADLPGTYVFSLAVNDGKLNSAPSTVTITAAAANVTPVANAGSAQRIVAGAVVTLDGSASSDANNDPLTYSWSLTTKPSASSTVLSSATAAKPTFTADLTGTYVFSLVVNDGKLSSDPAIVSITSIANEGSATFTIEW